MRHKQPKIVLRLRQPISDSENSYPPNSQNNVGSGDIKHSYMCTLKVTNFSDELAKILGDSEPAYQGIFQDDANASSTQNTLPNAEDRALLKYYWNASDTKKIPDNMLHTSKSSVSVHFGQKHAFDACYRSGYPAEYISKNYLSVCPYCLDYFSSDLVSERHSIKCFRKDPPGREIYQDNDISVWEVDGALSTIYSENLCLLAKAFLSSKALYRNVEGFFFYVLTRRDSNGFPEFVGYFSKQKTYTLLRPKEPVQSLSCIVTLPTLQKGGYGQFLIALSYLMMQIQEATGYPEYPLSDLGKKAFRRYWKQAVFDAVRDALKKKQKLSIKGLSIQLGMLMDHVVLALADLEWLEKTDGKYVISIKRKEANFVKDKSYLIVKPKKLLWTPVYE